MGQTHCMGQMHYFNASVGWLGSLGRVVDSFYSKSCGFFPLGAIGLGMPSGIRATVIAKDPYVFALTVAACRHCFKLVRIKSYFTTGKVPIPKMLGNFCASVLFLAWSMCLRFRSSCRTSNKKLEIVFRPQIRIHHGKLYILKLCDGYV